MGGSGIGAAGGIGRRRFLLNVGATATAVAIAGRRARAATPSEVRIGTFDETNPTAILQAQGTLDSEMGAKAVWKDVGSGGAFNTIAAADGIDIGLGLGTSPAAAGIAQGIPYQVIAMCDNIAGAEEMTVRRSANIKKPSDFIGKTVATPFGSTSNFRLAGFLTVHHLLGKVKVVYMSPADLVAAWTRGQIDAAYVWPPAKSKLLSNGGEVYHTYKQMDAAGYVIGDLIAVRTAFAEQYPETVVAFLKAYGKAVDLYTTDKQKAVALVAKATALSPAEAEADMAEYEFISLRGSLSKSWLGAPGKPGRLGSVMHRTAGFLHGQKSIASVPSLAVFEKGINSTYLAKAVG
jgi:taurine transport system substrate-binding protein